jgi:glycosyltransferase involved in cell wall biosynthesis
MIVSRKSEKLFREGLMKQQQWPDTVFVCIPSYKAASTLDRFLSDLLKKVPAEKVVVIDDASKDSTDQICLKHTVTCLTHTVNMGKGAALRTGFNHLIGMGNASWALTMDADGQHAIADIDRFLHYIDQNPATAICVGYREMRIGKMPLMRILSNRITSGIMSIYCHQPIRDSQCGYRLYSLSFISSISIEYNRFEMESEVLLKAAAGKQPIGFIPIQTLYLDGTSHISHFYDTIRWVRAVTSVRSALKQLQQKNGTPKQA